MLDEHMPDNNDDDLQLQIRIAMLHKHLTQQELGRRLGWTQPMVSRRLTGKTPIGLREALRIAEVLETSLDSLLTGVRS